MKHVTITPPAPAIAPPMTPWRYVRLRRLAVGRTIDEAAFILTRCNGSQEETAEFLRMLETEHHRALTYGSVRRLGAAFPIDADVYRQLCEEPAARHPTVCRQCGCSRWDDVQCAHRDVDHDPDGDADRAAGREHG